MEEIVLSKRSMTTTQSSIAAAPAVLALSAMIFWLVMLAKNVELSGEAQDLVAQFKWLMPGLFALSGLLFYVLGGKIRLIKKKEGTLRAQLRILGEPEIKIDPLTNITFHYRVVHTGRSQETYILHALLYGNEPGPRCALRSGGGQEFSPPKEFIEETTPLAKDIPVFSGPVEAVFYEWILARRNMQFREMEQKKEPSQGKS